MCAEDVNLGWPTFNEKSFADSCELNSCPTFEVDLDLLDLSIQKERVW